MSGMKAYYTAMKRCSSSRGSGENFNQATFIVQIAPQAVLAAFEMPSPEIETVDVRHVGQLARPVLVVDMKSASTAIAQPTNSYCFFYWPGGDFFDFVSLPAMERGNYLRNENRRVMQMNRRTLLAAAGASLGSSLLKTAGVENAPTNGMPLKSASGSSPETFN